MLTNHGILALLFTARALSALSCSIGQVTTQDSNNPYLASGQMGFDTQSTAPPIESRTVFLDDGIFIGTRVGATEKFLGIPFAIPP